MKVFYLLRKMKNIKSLKNKLFLWDDAIIVISCCDEYRWKIFNFWNILHWAHFHKIIYTNEIILKV